MWCYEIMTRTSGIEILANKQVLENMAEQNNSWMNKNGRFGHTLAWRNTKIFTKGHNTVEKRKR